jgi:CBS domain-containing protein
MPVKLENLMVRDVVTVDVKTTVKEAVELMNKLEIGCLVVVDGETPTGIVTERDMLKRVLVEARNPMLTRVNEVMSKPLLSAEPEMDIGDTVKLMFEHKIKKLPVIENGRLVGLVTLTDLIRSEEIVKSLKKLQLKTAPTRMKKIVDIYFDPTRHLRKRCPLITEGAQSMSCQREKCMWWFEDECVITKLTRQMLNTEDMHANEEE